METRRTTGRLRRSLPRTHNPFGTLCALIFTSLAPLPCQGTQVVDKSGWYVDSIHGLKIHVPAGWVYLPRKNSEKWIVAKFHSRRLYEGAVGSTNMTTMHKPTLRIIVFDDALVAQAKKDKPKNRPYANYRDWVQRKHGEEGVKLLHEGDGEQGGFKVSRFGLDITRQISGSRKQYVTWVFQRDGLHIAVEFEFLARHFKRLQKLALDALRTCVGIDRKGGPSVARRIAASRMTREDWRKLSTRKRLMRRVEEERARIKEAIANLPQGWSVSETPRFVILSHAPKKLTKNIAANAEICRKYIEARYGSINDEYVSRGIIRICKTYDELRVYRSSFRTAFLATDREIVVEGDNSYGSHGRGLGELFLGIFNHYIHAKDDLLYAHLPAWIHRGFGAWFRTATTKGKKMVFKPDDTEADTFRELRRAKVSPIAPKDMMLITRDAYSERLLAGQKMIDQVTRYHRFLQGPARKLKFLGKQDILVSYMQAVIEVASDYVAEHPEVEKKDDGDHEGETKEQRVARIKKRNDMLELCRAMICDRAFAKACQWSDADWAKLARAYKRFCK